MRISRKKIALILCISLFCCSLLQGCQRPDKTVEKYGFYFDTIINITLFGDYEESLIDDCFALAQECENLFSNTISSSDISKINDNPGKFVTVDPRTVDILQKAIAYGDFSQGIFDITIGKLVDLWNISELSKQEDNSDFDKSILPAQEDIANVKKNINYKAVIIDGTSVQLASADCKIDLGGIAKGYIADLMKEFLMEQGVTSACISLGGNILTIGEKPNHNPFKIGIQKPFSDRNDVIGTVNVKDKSVVTSGIYERYIKVNDTIYHHILDKSTGCPVENELLEVTIISNQSIDGDALSTICFLLGTEKGMEYIEALEDVEAVFVDKDYQITTTSGVDLQIP